MMMTCSRRVRVPASGVFDAHLAAVEIVKESHQHGVHVYGPGALFDILDTLF